MSNCKNCNDLLEDDAEFCDEKCATQQGKSFYITFTSIAKLLLERGKSITPEQAQELVNPKQTAKIWT